MRFASGLRSTRRGFGPRFQIANTAVGTNSAHVVGTRVASGRTPLAAKRNAQSLRASQFAAKFLGADCSPTSLFCSADPFITPESVGGFRAQNYNRL